jgi:hypothetical protein
MNLVAIGHCSAGILPAVFRAVAGHKIAGKTPALRPRFCM